MYSQQHTIPMTGEGAVDDLNLSSGTPWTTQPVTSQTRLGGGGFMRKLSQRSCSMKAVTSATTFPPVEEESSQKEGLGKSWGSVTNLHSGPPASSPPIPRSPSLPSLHPSKLNHCDTANNEVLSVSQITGTPQHADLKPNRYMNTPLQTGGTHNLNYSRVGLTPQHDIQKLGQTPQPKNHPLSAARNDYYCLNSTTKTGLQQDFLSTTKLGHPNTPQLGSHHNNKMFGSRAPLQPITPRQQPLSHGFLTSISKEGSGQNVLIEKENSQQSQCEQKLHKTSPPQVPAWRQQLLREILNNSPNEHLGSTPVQKNSPPVRKNLFDQIPVKQKQKSQVEHEQPVQVKMELVHCNKQEYSKIEGSQMANKYPSNQPYEPKPAESPAHLATPVPQKQAEYAFKQPLRPAELQGITESSKTIEHKFKPPPSRTEQGTQEVIVVKGVAYVVGHRLGRGGSSEVFQVTRQGDNSVLAIKCVNLRAVDEVIRDGYLNEITLLQRMQGSPRVVQLIDHELCESRQVLYVVMEKGARDLAAFLKDRAKRRDLRIGTVEAFWQDMVEAVAAIHERGIIHSDLKPANFLLVGEVGFHQLKLIDFGIASSLQSDMTSVVRETPAGTLNYMSPEAVRGMQGQQCPVKINYKSDIWSLGCILYNLLYGRTPFQHIGHPALKAEAICNPQHAIEFPTKSQILPGDGTVPPALLRTVMNCLNRDPVDRPSAPQLLAVKYCGCQQTKEASVVDTLAQSLANLILVHPLGKELAVQLVAALQENGERKKDGVST